MKNQLNSDHKRQSWTERVLSQLVPAKNLSGTGVDYPDSGVKILRGDGQTATDAAFVRYAQTVLDILGEAESRAELDNEFYRCMDAIDALEQHATKGERLAADARRMFDELPESVATEKQSDQKSESNETVADGSSSPTDDGGEMGDERPDDTADDAEEPDYEPLDSIWTDERPEGVRDGFEAVYREYRKEVYTTSDESTYVYPRVRAELFTFACGGLPEGSLVEGIVELDRRYRESVDWTRDAEYPEVDSDKYPEYAKRLSKPDMLRSLL
ncbi:hypothetical protein N0B31_22355 (plasmid) [Salinirubellus salinus]|uniref:Uncharacterized protein n=1 Tax=Salinirubellus salinus TaxID=1364945 RepID=A0A9E7R6T7_9EURY|nr:hypothetical protein [Salinirubellus salinus]UWM56991.1 hypothetical protein N0B31_22355 [Salinirubellus salinus]